MKNFSKITLGLIGFLILVAPLAFAEAASVSVQSLSPGATVFAKDRLTFVIVPSGFVAQSYQLSDSFPGSTASASNISGVGNFFWNPLPSDVGTHTFTITAQDYTGDSASITQVITVAPAPALSIQSVLPGTTIMPGTKFSFTVSESGFTNPSYTVSDAFSGSSVGDANLDTSENFSWTPDLSQDGGHSITVYAYDSQGHSASISQPVHVGAGPTLGVILVSPGASVPIGTTTTFRVTSTNFSPTSFAVSDSFPGSSVSNNNVTTSGFFSWMPQASDVGVHLLTILGVVGTFGQSATTSQTITVLGPNGAVPTPTPVPNTTSNPATSQTQLSTTVTAQSSTPTLSSGFIFYTYLHPGMHGDEVSRLQAILAQQGFLSGAPTGYYGSLTVDAVAKFQAAHGLNQLGVVGPATRAILNTLQSQTQTPATASTASPTSDGYVFKNFMGFGEDSTDGTDVIELQKRLATLGLFSGAQTGYFGSATQEAVKQFQAAHGITATGYVGSVTRAALNN